MNTLFGKILFFAVRAMRGENVFKFNREVKSWERFNSDEIVRQQTAKLRELLSQHHNIPFLDKTIREGKIDINKITPQNLWQLFPVQTKDLISNSFDDFVNRKYKSNLSLRSTSGSTGKPFRFYRDRISLAYMDSVMYNAYSWHGVAIGDRQARFWGMPFDERKRKEANLKDFLMNRIRLSAFDLSGQAMHDNYQRLFRFRPIYIYGYPSFVYRFARFCGDNNLPLAALNLKAVIVTGEKVAAFNAEYMENAFATKVVQEYGCSEVGVMAFQCPQGRMHVMAPNIIIEVLKNGQPVTDEPGNIVVTELNTRSFPFIRYQLGDIGTLHGEKCSCGLAWPLLTVAEGRIDDYIVTPEGVRVYDAVLAYTINAYQKQVVSFKATQKKNGDLSVLIKPSPLYTPTVGEELVKQLKDRISPSINILLECVDDIPPEKSGKLRYFVSEYKS